VHAPGAGTETLDRRVSQAYAQRMTHVVHGSTVGYRPIVKACGRLAPLAPSSSSGHCMS
jgi:hypothetical protein